jgi:hypothetical protein
LFIYHSFNVLSFAQNLGNSISVMVNGTFDNLMKKTRESEGKQRDIFSSYQKVALKW